MGTAWMLTQREVAARLGLTRINVAMIERRALAKLRRHPKMIEIALELGLKLPRRPA